MLKERVFCTYFDQSYLIRGLTLYRSLERSHKSFILYVLCLDNETYKILSTLAIVQLIPIRLDLVEKKFPGLLTAKKNRSLVEYYFTLSPFFPLYLLKTLPELDIITYVEADLFFYGSTEPIFDQLGNESILIVPHRFPSELKQKEKYGLFNIQYQSFRNDKIGIKCLERWKDQCLEWCFDRLEDRKFADQKYLDEWPDLYDRLVISQDVGVGVAPWNIGGYEISTQSNKFTVNGKPIVFYHFHGLKILGRRLISHGIGSYKKPDGIIVRWLYCGYMRELALSRRLLSEAVGGRGSMADNSDLRKGRSRWVHFLNGIWKRQILLLDDDSC